MKKSLILTCLLLAVSAGFAVAAPGLQLGWGQFCPTSGSSQADKSDPCDGTGPSPYHLTGSVTLAVAQSQIFSGEMELDLQEAGGLLSNYWHLEDENQPGQINPAGCRGGNPGTGNIGSLVVKSDQSVFVTSLPCNKTMWGTNAANVNWLPGVGGPDRARLNIIVGRTSAFNGLSGTQYYSFDAAIDNNHQIDDPLNPPNYVCDGCLHGVCIVYNVCVLRQPQGATNGDQTYTQANVRRHVTWQGGVNTICPGATPTQKATWGQVKSLYR